MWRSGWPRAWRVSRRRLRENFSVGMADVVGFQFFGTNRLAPLEPLPTQTGNRASVRILNKLSLNSRSPNHRSQHGIGRDNRLLHPFKTLGLGNKLFPGQQAFAAHMHLRLEFAVADIHVTPTSL